MVSEITISAQSIDWDHKIRPKGSRPFEKAISTASLPPSKSVRWLSRHVFVATEPNFWARIWAFRRGSRFLDRDRESGRPVFGRLLTSAEQVKGRAFLVKAGCSAPDRKSARVAVPGQFRLVLSREQSRPPSPCRQLVHTNRATRKQMTRLDAGFSR